MTSDARFAADWQRPTYHFLPPANWMNDPNGLIQWQGIYHLFYQYNPGGAFHADMHWGHARSRDLVHWEHLPIALAPTPDSYDAGGIFSGCAVAVDRVPTILYTAVEGPAQLPALATSDDPDLITWTKFPGNPVIPAPPAAFETTIFRDHTVWREDGDWFQAIGSGIVGAGGNALVYRSPDFQHWTFVGPLVDPAFVPEGPAAAATGWECPDFFALGDRHMLTVSMWAHHPINVSFLSGHYAGHIFTPERQGLVDPGSAFYAPQSFTDEQGRRIMFGWLREQRPVPAQKTAGWSGVMSLPRVLALLPGGALGAAPVPAVDDLRGAHVTLTAADLHEGEDLPLGAVAGDAIELMISLQPGSGEGTVTAEVLRAADGEESTRISYDLATRTLTLDTTAASLNSDCPGEVATITLPGTGEEVRVLRIFVDHSVVEVFAGNAASIAGRAYTTSPASTGVRVTATGDASLIERIDVWAMAV